MFLFLIFLDPYKLHDYQNIMIVIMINILELGQFKTCKKYCCVIVCSVRSAVHTDHEHLDLTNRNVMLYSALIYFYLRFLLGSKAHCMHTLRPQALNLVQKPDRKAVLE